jgi:DNA-binding MarR family transcriptional regulator
VPALIDVDFQRLLEFRIGLRRFLRWSEEEAHAAGLTPAQHQLLLAVRGTRGAPTIGDVAQALLIRHHSAVELVGRAEAAGLLGRRADPDDARVTRLVLTPLGARTIERLTASHLAELERMRPAVRRLWAGLDAHT